MPYRQRIINISEYKNEKRPIVSLYLNVTPPWEFKSKINSLIRSQIKELREEKTLSQDELGRMEKLLLRIEEYVKNKEGSFKQTKLFVLFANTEGYWEEFEMPVGHPSMLTVRSTPYLRPLRVLEEQFPHYCVVVTDSNKTKVFSYSGGRIVEKRQITAEEEEIGETDEASSGFGEQRYQRYIKDRALRHMKRAADIVFHLYRTGDYDKLIIGATDARNLTTFKNNLHSYLKEALAGEIHAGPENNNDIIRKKTAEVAEEWEKKKEAEMVDRLIENAYSEGFGVMGAGPTIKALMNGQVQTLIVDPNIEKPGYFCPNDHYLSLSLQKCPLCSTELKKSENIIDEMVEETIEQSGEVKHLFNYQDRLDGNAIGALLRFLVQ